MGSVKTTVQERQGTRRFQVQNASQSVACSNLNDDRRNEPDLNENTESQIRDNTAGVLQVSRGNEDLQLLSANPFEILRNVEEEIEVLAETQIARTLGADRSKIPIQIPRLKTSSRILGVKRGKSQQSNKNVGSMKGL